MSHQSHDNWCKMIKFEIIKTDNSCFYKPIEARYRRSSLSSSICYTKSQVIDNFNSPTGKTGLAQSQSQGGYGIETLMYEICPEPSIAPANNAGTTPTCSEDLTIAGYGKDYVSLGACGSVDDFEPQEVKYQGTWIGYQMEKNIH